MFSCEYDSQVMMDYFCDFQNIAHGFRITISYPNFVKSETQLLNKRLIVRMAFTL